MSIGLCYWILVLLWLVNGIWSHWPITLANVRPAGGTILFFAMLVLLGWQVFGPPLKKSKP